MTTLSRGLRTMTPERARRRGGCTGLGPDHADDRRPRRPDLELSPAPALSSIFEQAIARVSGM